jgi:hypothetical protein
MQWSPEYTFIVTYVAAAMSGIGVLLLDGTTLSGAAGFRKVLGTIFVYGSLGAGFGMVVGYEYLGGRENPWKAIACGMLVGVKAIKVSDIIEFARRVLSIKVNGT